jgi:hypothetical protein
MARKISDNVKYDVVTDEHGSYAVIYARRKDGAFAKFGECHVSVIEEIRRCGLRALIENRPELIQCEGV